MKKTYILMVMLLMVCMQMMGQAKKPKLMVMPTDRWCIEHGYVLTFDDQGTQVTMPDYKKAFQMDTELNNMITRMGNIMSDRGFDLVLMEDLIKSIERISAENALITSNTSGATIAETPLDQYRRQANADILLQLDWQVNKTGPKKSITYNLRGLDAYSVKQIAGAQETGAPSMATELPVMLEEAVTAHMDNFVARLHAHFEKLLQYGREIKVDINVFDNGSGINLETEFDGIELQEIIENWISDNTVEHRYNLADGTDTYMTFDQVMIPLYRPNGSGMSAYNFVNELRKYLRGAPYNITCKTINRGLGRCMLTIGEK